MSEKSSVKRPLSRLLFTALLLALFCLNFRIAKTEEIVAYPAIPYPAIQVIRYVQINNGGALVINDTVTLSASESQNVAPLNSFQISFPIAYENNLTYFFAYDASGPLQTTLDTTLNTTEFCSITISFNGSINVSNGGSYNFTVVYVFSGLVELEATGLFYIVFPLYPSLAEKAEFCNVTVTFPAGATYTSYSSVFLNKTMDSRKILYNETSPLEPYAIVSSWAKFTSTDFMLLRVDEMRREIKIDGWGSLSATDFYEITKKNVAEITEIKITFVLPPNATGISVQDVYGTYAQNSVTIKEEKNYTTVEVSIRAALLTSERAKFLVAYNLPFWKYIAQNSWQDYALNISLVRPETWVIKRFVVTISLPEGAEFQPDTKTLPNFENLERNVFLETANFAYDNLTKFHVLNNFNLKYRYLILWASFRPTIWIGTVMAIIGAAIFLRKAPKPAVIVTIPLSPEFFRKFVDTYEERRKITLEMGSLEQRVQRGKISRRQYKLRRSSLDGRLSKLQKDLVELRRKIEAIGGRFAEMMKRLEIAEAEIETLNTDIERVEVRYRRGELSAEARHRLLNEYNRRKDQAENTIAETLLRIREEIR